MVMLGPPGQSPQHKRADFQPRLICDLNPPLPCMVTRAQVRGFRTWTSWGPYFPAERGSLAHSERRSARLTQCVLGAGTLRPRAWSRGSEGPPAPRAAPGRWPLPGRGRAAGGPGAGSGGRGWTSSQARRASPWQCGRAAGAAATRPPPPLPTVVTGALAGLWVSQALPSHHPPGRAFPGLRSQCRTDGGQGATSQARPRGFGPAQGWSRLKGFGRHILRDSEEGLLFALWLRKTITTGLANRGAGPDAVCICQWPRAGLWQAPSGKGPSWPVLAPPASARRMEQAWDPQAPPA